MQERFHQSIPLGAPIRLHLDNAVGAVQIEGWSREKVDVQATKSAPSIGDLHNIKIDVSVRGENVSISAQYTGMGHEGGVSYSVLVPFNAAIEVVNGTGKLEITGVRGDVSASTTVGEIDADLGVVASHRVIELTATTGAIRAAIARDSSARVNASTTVGQISTDFQGVSVNRSVVGATATGDIGSGSALVHLGTITGAIALTSST